MVELLIHLARPFIDDVEGNRFLSVGLTSFSLAFLVVFSLVSFMVLSAGDVSGSPYCMLKYRSSTIDNPCDGCRHDISIPRTDIVSDTSKLVTQAILLFSRDEHNNG